MESNYAKFWIGLGVGSVLGAVAYCFTRTSKYQCLKDKACHVLHAAAGRTSEVVDEVKDKASDVMEAVKEKAGNAGEKVTERFEKM